jgi:AAA family ATP:ADP antiporter
MDNREQLPAQGAIPHDASVFYRFLNLFVDIRKGEAAKALLLALTVFLFLLAYYILKPLREVLLLVDKDSPVVKSCLSGIQAILLIFVIKAFSRLASRVARHILITWTTLFFISNLLIFYVFSLCGMPIKTMGIIFFIWIGIFNLLVIAQFWGFANDLYAENAGKRIFPLIGFGATTGAVVGTRMQWLRELMGDNWEYDMMLIAGAILLVCIGLVVYIHVREVRKTQKEKAEGLPGAEEKARVQGQPLKPGGGFRLILDSRYLLMIALMIGIYNFVNATGEYIITDVQTQASLQAAAISGADMQKSIHTAFMNYQFLTNVIALVIQLFLVSRIFKRVGVAGALFVLPLIALGGYGLISFGALLVVIQWVKALENGTDYSLQNTTKAALFLVTPREEKYKAKAAIDTFFVRGGDTISAVAILVGTQLLALKIERYALLNVLGVVVWIFLCIVILREYGKRKNSSESLP